MSIMLTNYTKEKNSSILFNEYFYEFLKYLNQIIDDYLNIKLLIIY